MHSAGFIWIERLLGALCPLLAGGLLSFSMRAQPLPSAHFTGEDGLPSSTVYQVLQDQKGLIWMATDRGVLRFDGLEFTHFSTAGGLPLQDIWSLREDAQGRIFLGSYYPGMLYIERDSIHVLPYTEKGAWQRRKPVLMGHNPVCYWYGRRASFLKKGIIHSLYPLAEEAGDWQCIGKLGDAFYFVRLKEHQLFPESQVVALARKQGQDMRQLPLPSTPLYGLNPPSDGVEQGRLLLRSADSLYRYHLAQGRWEVAPLPAPPERIAPLHLLPRQMLRQGDSIYYLGEGKDSLHLNQPFPRLPGDKGSYHYFVDRQGHWWVWARGKGVFLFSRYQLSVRRLSPPGLQVREAVVAPPGSLYFTARTEGYGAAQMALYRWQDGHTQLLSQTLKEPVHPLVWQGHLALFDAALGLSSLYWLPIAARAEGRGRSPKPQVWRKTSQPYSLPASGPAQHVFHPQAKPAVKDHWRQGVKGPVYLGYHRGLLRLAGVPGADHYQLHQLLGPRVQAITGTADSLFWGNSTGLYVSPRAPLDSGGAWLHHRLNGFSQPVLELAHGVNGPLLIGTDGYGLWYRLSPEDPIRGPLPGTRYQVVIDLEISPQGVIWALTQNGVHAYQKEADTLRLLPNLSRGASELPGKVSDLAVDTGQLYLATSSGLLQTPFHRTRVAEAPRLLEPQWNGRVDTDPARPLRLPYDHGRLGLAYKALAYAQQADLRYHYRLLGADSSWQTTTSRSRAFLNLQPGRYCFQLYASTGPAAKSAMYQKTILVATPWWQNPWWQGFGGLLALTALPLWVWRWQRRKRRHAEERARLEQRLARLELEALQAQMNPHFIFNALTAIQNYILENDLEEADRYLVKFARLMRGFLEASQSHYIALQEELRLLQLYIDLEQLRHPQRFEVRWDVPQPLDPSLEVPTLLFQPFVENAINHGLRHAPGPGILSIAIKPGPEQDLEVIIEDNGVGLEAHSARTGAAHQGPSRGLGLLRDRLGVLEAQGGQRYHIQLESRQPLPGTRVRIHLTSVLP